MPLQKAPQMILHPNISRDELTDYCRLCHEHRIKSVRVESAIAKRIKELTCNTRPQYLGIEFKTRL